MEPRWKTSPRCWKTRSRCARSSIRCFRIIGFFALITIALVLALKVLRTYETERYNTHEIASTPNTLHFDNKDGLMLPAERGDNKFVREQDIASELLLYLQKGQLSDTLKGPMWKEVLMTLKSSRRIQTVFTQEFAFRNKRDTKSCQPKNNIFFLKTHKTASSSIMNILFRYGEFHNLTFAFPTEGASYAYANFFKTSFVNGFSDQSKKIFNIMCHHLRFDYTEIKKVMPEDTFYFTILRNPISQMESSFSYFKDFTAFKNATNLDDFLQNSKIFYKDTKDISFFKNLLTFDLGFELDGSPGQSVLAWHAMDNIFDLVIITEYYDESLILLKDALCWSFYDVLSFPLNSRSNNTRKTLTLETQEKVKSWNRLDWEMYTYFNNSFWKRVQTFGVERMERELKELKRIKTVMFDKCLEGEVDPKKLKDRSMMPCQAGLATILGYNLKPGLPKDDELLCQRLVTPELQYHEILKKKAEQ
ncbi:galactose-3-O-sulfotransferase 2-like [Anomaloglossus baeobatrachus]